MISGVVLFDIKLKHDFAKMAVETPSTLKFSLAREVK
jgi:hypothetical protein